VGARIAILAIGFLSALMVRRFLTHSSGLTYTRANGTRYVAFNIVVFWLVIVATVALCLLR
jgi:hypothetical protein